MVSDIKGSILAAQEWKNTDWLLLHLRFKGVSNENSQLAGYHLEIYESKHDAVLWSYYENVVTATKHLLLLNMQEHEESVESSLLSSVFTWCRVDPLQQQENESDC